MSAALAESQPTESQAAESRAAEAQPAQSAGFSAAGRDHRSTTLFEAVGGMAFFERLVDRFYAAVEADPVLLSLYPERQDLGPARRRLTLFLAQYWGGPTTYSDERGHPRLRGRHFAFRIGPEERDHWLAAMRGAMRELDVPPVVAEKLDEYFVVAADAMRNEP